MYDIFTLSFYGSPLWNLFSDEVERLYRSYNIAVRIAYKVDRATRTFLIEPLTQSYHPHTLLCSRFFKFHQTNLNCNKPTIRMLATLYQKDLRTVYGNNLRMISNICSQDIDNLTTMEIKNKVKYRSLPKDEEWRIPILMEMLFSRENNIAIDGLSKRDIDHIITYVCIIWLPTLVTLWALYQVLLWVELSLPHLLAIPTPYMTDLVIKCVKENN